MKKLRFTNSALLLILLVVATACQGLFIPDPIDPRLPKYTEQGNNVAGAYINGAIWESTVIYSFGFKPGPLNAPRVDVWPQKDSLTIRFSGSVSGQKAAIQFHLQGQQISEFSDLLQLNGQKITLDGNTNAGYFIENSNELMHENSGVGQLFFRTVRQDSTRMILSGTFGFSADDADGKTLSVSSGRFDYRLTEAVNFQIEPEL